MTQIKFFNLNSNVRLFGWLEQLGDLSSDTNWVSFYIKIKLVSTFEHINFIWLGKFAYLLVSILLELRTELNNTRNYNYYWQHSYIFYSKTANTIFHWRSLNRNEQLITHHYIRNSKDTFFLIFTSQFALPC